MAIRSFKTKEVEAFFEKGKLPNKAGWSSLKKIVMRKLDMLEYAKEIQDLRSPPSNRLEILKGNLKGYYSIRINDQWRVTFQWENGPIEVDLVDYH